MTEVLWTLWTTILIIGTLSLLIKENKFYTIVEHIAIGGGVAHLLVMALVSVNTSGFKPALEGNYILIIPIILGFLSLARLTQWKWLSRYSYALLISIGVGVMLAAVIEGQIIGQMRTIGNFILQATNSFEMISGIIGAIGVITGITYFIYTREHTGALGISARIGRIFLMISFGTCWAAEVSWFLGALSGQIETVLNNLMSILGL